MTQTKDPEYPLIMKPNLEVSREDITKLHVDAIVNAANSSLLGGGGVDGAIHRAAGPGLIEVCRLLGGCPTGEAKITKGFNLPARFIIHTVGPVWNGGHANEAGLLAQCYRNSLRLAMEHNCKVIAFPNISTGIYHFPKKEAAEIAIREIKEFLSRYPVPEKVILTCFDAENFDIYQSLLKIV